MAERRRNGDREYRDYKDRESSDSGMFAGRVPPQNLDAEASILGAVLIDTDGFLKIADQLTADDFYLPEHQAIFGAMQGLFEKRTPIDLVTLRDELDSRKELEIAGGASKLASLAAGVLTSSNIVHYATIVRQKALLRRLISAAGKIGEIGFKEELDTDVVLDEAERALFGVTQKHLKQNFVSIRSVLDESFERLGMLAKGDGGLRGIPTGFRGLDRLLGGLQRSDLLILAARPAMGKTVMAMNIAEAVARNGYTVGVFSLEMSKEQLVDRLVSSIGRVDAWKLRSGNLNEEDLHNLIQAQAELAEARLFIDDGGMATVTEVRAKARRLQAEHGLDLIVIDYLQLMSGGGKNNSDNRVQEVSEISRGLKALAKELNVPIIALSQLSRAVEARTDKRPMLSDLRESGSIEQDADLVMFLYRDDYYNKVKEEHNHLVEVIIAKHRNGPTGDVKLSSQLQYSRFYDLELGRNQG